MLDLPSLRDLQPRRYGLASWSDHVPFAFDIVAAQRPDLLVELGTHSGESFFAFCQAVREQGRSTQCYAVDTWQGDHQAGFYGAEVLADVTAHRREMGYEGFSHLVRKTFDAAAVQFAPDSIDLLHLDGLHTYEAVRHDFETWLPLVRPGGIVLLHDVSERHEDFGVWRLWEEIVARTPESFEFTHCHGLGVWRKPGGPAPGALLQSLFAGGQAELWRLYYQAAADRLRLPALLREASAAAEVKGELDRTRHERNVVAAAADAAQARHETALEAARIQQEAAARRFAALVRKLEFQEDEIGRWRAELAASAGRVRSMQESLSWKATLPFRALSRLTNRRQVPVEATPEARASVDLPHTWHLLAGITRFRGWCLSGTGAAPARVRIRYRGAFFPATLHPRPDVAEAFALSPVAYVCGFEVDLPLEPGRARVSVEARFAPSHKWQQVFRRRARVTGAQLTLAASTYRPWLHRYERFEREALVAIRERLEGLKDPPLLSVLMPTCEPPLPWLRRAILSVQGQSYPHWELCIADDASRDPGVRELVEEFVQAEPRIRFIARPERGNISHATNSALGLASGSWVTFLDHDDELHPAALAEVALTIAARPGVRLIYTDEDKVDARQRRFDPYFKPDWNPELLRGQNYLCHLTAIQTDAVRALGGLRAGVEGCQDWDLALRITERLAPEEIHHIPRVLYHWRAIPGSTALSQDQKSGIAEAAARTLREHLGRTGETTSQLIPVSGGHWRIRRAVPLPEPLVSIIIPTRDALGILRLCLESVLARSTYRRFEIVVVDNDSKEPATLDWLQEIVRLDPRVQVRPHAGPFNYAALHNAIVPGVAGEFVCLLNNDIEVISPEWLDEMVACAAAPGVGVVGAKLLYPDGTIQHAGVVLGIGGVAGHAFKHFPGQAHGQMNRLQLAQNYSAVTAACMVFRKERWAEAGGMDEKNLAIAFNDVDFCLRVRAAGYRNLWTPAATLVHHESLTRGHEDSPDKVMRFKRETQWMRERWGADLDADPAYNPNLSIVHEDFSLAEPPRAWRNAR